MWLLYAGLAGCAALAGVVLPDGSVRTGLVLAVGLSAVAAVAAGTWLHRPAYELPWVVLATGLATSVAAEVVAALTGPISDFGPAWSDVVHLAAYPLRNDRDVCRRPCLG